MARRSRFHNNPKETKKIKMNIQNSSIYSVSNDIKRESEEEQLKQRNYCWEEIVKLVREFTNYQINILLKDGKDCDYIIRRLNTQDGLFEKIRFRVKQTISFKDLSKKQKATENKETKLINPDNSYLDGMIIASFNEYVRTIDSLKIAYIRNSMNKKSTPKSQNNIEYNR